MSNSLYMFDKAVSVLGMLVEICKASDSQMHEQCPHMFVFRKREARIGFEFKVPSHNSYSEFWSLPQTKWNDTAKFLLQTEADEHAEGYVVTFCARSPQAKNRPDALILAVFSKDLNKGECFFVDLSNPNARNIEPFDSKNMPKLLPALISPSP